MKKTNNTTKNSTTPVWIETNKDYKGKRVLKIGADWGCVTGFDKKTTKKLFDAVSTAVKTVIPTAEINPWADDKHGTPDFE